MTRARFNRRLRMIYLLCGLVLIISLAAQLAKHIPGLQDDQLIEITAQVYSYMRDMALVLVTMAAVYLADVFQKRSKFVASLEEEWREMVKTKNKLVLFCDREDATLNDYLTAYERMSATLDNMRIVYRNVGETDHLIGLYPYSPLHDMRRALETLDPRRSGVATAEQRRIVRTAIQQSFKALRETFLEELDLEEPTHGQLVSGARRVKKPGATRRARAQQKRQQRRLSKRTSGSGDEAVNTLLAEAYQREQSREADGK
ncbi:MAG: hypothetical protein ACI9XZ_001987 [Alphaproteobacteria bacterium]|jgi:hypothetical protein